MTVEELASHLQHNIEVRLNAQGVARTVENVQCILAAFLAEDCYRVGFTFSPVETLVAADFSATFYVATGASAEQARRFMAEAFGLDCEIQDGKVVATVAAPQIVIAMPDVGGVP